MKTNTSLAFAGGLVGILIISIVVYAQQNPSVTSISKSGGEQIYLSGKDSSGESIAFTSGPDWYKQSDGGCIVCHGADGRGGRIPNSGRYAPSIQYSVIKSEGYTDDKIGRAITKGEDASGASLSSTMPRYSLSDEQLAGLLEYIKRLGVSKAPESATLKAEGQRIYWNGTNLSGSRVTFSGGPAWFATRGGGCILCHGRNGQGSMVRECLRRAPNIQYKVLKARHYTDTQIKRAITQGINTAGTRLNNFMPRWKMTDEQLDAIVVYLETLNSK